MDKKFKWFTVEKMKFFVMIACRFKPEPEFNAYVRNLLKSRKQKINVWAAEDWSAFHLPDEFYPKKEVA